MKKRLTGALALVGGIITLGITGQPAAAVDRVGQDAFGGWTDDAPGIRRLIRPSDLPPPYATVSNADAPVVVPRPAGAALRVPEGFRVSLFADGLSGPRVVRVAPNGDVFVSEGLAGQIRVLRPNHDDSHARSVTVYATGLNRPFGLAFYPNGDDPTHLYVAQTNGILRFPYRNGDLKPRGKPEVLDLKLPTGEHGLPAGGHWTRDIVFGPLSHRMFVSVGSATNVAEEMPERSAAFIAEHEAKHGRGAAWGGETNRAVVLVGSPTGRNLRSFATGLRNCTAMALHPETDDLWCAATERDRLGDDLPPEFVTRVRFHGFYGWPWFYPGGFEDPRQAGERPDLAPHVLAPDVLIQPHSSPLGITFYDGSQFPAKYRNNAFVTLRGSWNRSIRTGYKVVRIVTDKSGASNGWYEDFLTGFVLNNDEVWGRPVGIDVARDGSLLVSEDGNGTIWRIAYQP